MIKPFQLLQRGKAWKAYVQEALDSAGFELSRVRHDIADIRADDEPTAWMTEYAAIIVTVAEEAVMVKLPIPQHDDRRRRPEGVAPIGVVIARPTYHVRLSRVVIIIRRRRRDGRR